MAKIIDDIKMLYSGENVLKKHLMFIGVFVLCRLLTEIKSISLVFDIASQVFLMGCIVLYIQNILTKNDATMPDIREIDWKKSLKAFGLFVLWGVALAIPGLILLVCNSLAEGYYDDLLFVVVNMFLGILTFSMALPAMNIVFAYIEKPSAKEFLKPSLISKLFPVFLDTFVVILKYFGLMLLILLPFMILFGILDYIGFDYEKTAFFPLIAIFVCGLAYFSNILSTFCVPKALLQIYLQKVRGELLPEEIEINPQP